MLKLVTGVICTSDLSGAPVVALEAECCSLAIDSLGAFTDEHYCGPLSHDVYAQ